MKGTPYFRSAAPAASGSVHQTRVAISEREQMKTLTRQGTRHKSNIAFIGDRFNYLFSFAGLEFRSVGLLHRIKLLGLESLSLLRAT